MKAVNYFTQTEDILWYKNFDWSMIWTCVGAVIVLILFMETNRGKQATGAGLYMKPSPKNYLYHLTAGLLTLTFISELGYSTIKPFLNLSLEAEGNLLHFLAALSGIGGGYIIAKLIKIVQKLN